MQNILAILYTGYTLGCSGSHAECISEGIVPHACAHAQNLMHLWSKVVQGRGGGVQCVGLVGFVCMCVGSLRGGFGLLVVLSVSKGVSLIVTVWPCGMLAACA